jgi:hypothetical protein
MRHSVHGGLGVMTGGNREVGTEAPPYIARRRDPKLRQNIAERHYIT